MRKFADRWRPEPSWRRAGPGSGVVRKMRAKGVFFLPLCLVLALAGCATYADYGYYYPSDSYYYPYDYNYPYYYSPYYYYPQGYFYYPYSYRGGGPGGHGGRGGQVEGGSRGGGVGAPGGRGPGGEGGGRGGHR